MLNRAWALLGEANTMVSTLVTRALENCFWNASLLSRASASSARRSFTPS